MVRGDLLVQGGQLRDLWYARVLAGRAAVLWRGLQIDKGAIDFDGIERRRVPNPVLQIPCPRFPILRL